MEMDRPPTCKYTWAEDGKQEIYLEWPKSHMHQQPASYITSLSQLDYST